MYLLTIWVCLKMWYGQVFFTANDSLGQGELVSCSVFLQKKKKEPVPLEVSFKIGLNRDAPQIIHL